MKNLMINLYFFGSFIPMPFALLWGYKMWKKMTERASWAQFLMVGMLYGGLFILSILLTTILSEIAYNYL